MRRLARTRIGVLACELIMRLVPDGTIHALTDHEPGAVLRLASAQ